MDAVKKAHDPESKVSMKTQCTLFLVTPKGHKKMERSSKTIHGQSRVGVFFDTTQELWGLEWSRRKTGDEFGRSLLQLALDTTSRLLGIAPRFVKLPPCTMGTPDNYRQARKVWPQPPRCQYAAEGH
ncbi:hypothetical protein GWK47_027848 [Chionoecetes opilio]|uniref:Uncharacterized protein n=1 Tax=Chionoecetes opilio TaxID=41210 RepID=A0A8J8WBH4_CHIOP|nr:hypothetical protein GWK47_027848 [Chionoecetes opilio]